MAYYKNTALTMEKVFSDMWAVIYLLTNGKKLNLLFKVPVHSN